jgi:hypothetical protein
MEMPCSGFQSCKLNPNVTDDEYENKAGCNLTAAVPGSDKLATNAVG